MLLDFVITVGMFAVMWLIVGFIRDDNMVPRVPDVPPSSEGADIDDDLDLGWSLGIGVRRDAR